MELLSSLGKLKTNLLEREIVKILETKNDEGVEYWMDVARVCGISHQLISQAIRRTSKRTKVWRIQKKLGIPEWKFACLIFGIKAPDSDQNIIPALKKLGIVEENNQTILTIGELFDVLLAEVSVADILNKLDPEEKEVLIKHLTNQEDK